LRLGLHLQCQYQFLAKLTKEAILKNRVRECIAAQEAKLKTQRANALKVYLYCQLYRKMILPLQAWSEA
jgi:hypothetical protein